MKAKEMREAYSSLKKCRAYQIRQRLQQLISLFMENEHKANLNKLGYLEKVCDQINSNIAKISSMGLKKIIKISDLTITKFALLQLIQLIVNTFNYFLQSLNMMKSIKNFLDRTICGLQKKLKDTFLKSFEKISSNFDQAEQDQIQIFIRKSLSTFEKEISDRYIPSIQIAANQQFGKDLIQNIIQQQQGTENSSQLSLSWLTEKSETIIQQGGLSQQSADKISNQSINQQIKNQNSFNQHSQETPEFLIKQRQSISNIFFTNLFDEYWDFTDKLVKNLNLQSKDQFLKEISQFLLNLSSKISKQFKVYEENIYKFSNLFINPSIYEAAISKTNTSNKKNSHKMPSLYRMPSNLKKIIQEIIDEFCLVVQEESFIFTKKIIQNTDLYKKKTEIPILLQSVFKHLQRIIKLYLNNAQKKQGNKYQIKSQIIRFTYFPTNLPLIIKHQQLSNDILDDLFINKPQTDQINHRDNSPIKITQDKSNHNIGQTEKKPNFKKIKHQGQTKYQIWQLLQKLVMMENKRKNKELHQFFKELKFDILGQSEEKISQLKHSIKIQLKQKIQVKNKFQNVIQKGQKLQQSSAGLEKLKNDDILIRVVQMNSKIKLCKLRHQINQIFASNKDQAMENKSILFSPHQASMQYMYPTFSIWPFDPFKKGLYNQPWFIQMEEIEIKKRLQKITLDKFKQFKAEVHKVQSIIEELIFNDQQTCRKHKKQVYYVRLNEYKRQNIYLCNYCIEQSNEYRGKQINCSQHRKIINYKLIQPQINEQIFLCQSCIGPKQGTEITFLSHCHFKQIAKLCIQLQCIKNDQFKICNQCLKNHQNHKLINFSEEKIMDQFNIAQKKNIDQVQKQFIQIKQNLKLTPIIKLTDSYYRDICHILKFLESFVVCSNDSLKKWVKNVMKELLKEDLFLLWGVSQLNKSFNNDKDKSEYLEVFNDLLEIKIQVLLIQISDSLKQFKSEVEKIVYLTRQEIDQKLNKKYGQIIDIQTNKQTLISEFTMDQIHPNYFSRIKKVLVQKQRQETSYQTIAKNRKSARINFFRHQIQQKLNQTYYKRIESICHSSLSQQFKRLQRALANSLINFVKPFYYSPQLNSLPDRSLFDIQELKDIEPGSLNQELQKKQIIHQLFQIQTSNYRLLPIFSIKYAKQCKLLKQSLQYIQKQFERKQRQCLPMQQIIKNQFNTLRVIHIQNGLDQNGQCHYSISAFDLFQVVYKNKQLDELILKGVQVQQFQQFTCLLNPKNHSQPTYSKICDKSWMKNFSPSKSLKLSIDLDIKFNIHQPKKTLSRIIDLTFFKSLFYWLSDKLLTTQLLIINDYGIKEQKAIQIELKYQSKHYLIETALFNQITVQVKLEKWKQINIPEELWNCLKGIKKIKIRVNGNYNYIQAYCVGFVRSGLFKNLSSFTEIVQLSFYQMKFGHRHLYQKYMEQIEGDLRILFENNSVVHLQLYWCSGFPSFPTITSLSSINLYKSQYIKKVIQRNPSLKSIKFLQVNQIQMINEQLFDQLQYLLISYRDNISFNILSCSPSNIKYLKIWSQEEGQVKYLPKIFPKLANLIYLSLLNVGFGQFIQLIPSSNLKELQVFNSTITDKTLGVIDSKWPYLSTIALKNCIKLTKSAWRMCKFKGLIQLKIDLPILQGGNKDIQQLFVRGIKVTMIGENR